MLRLKWFFLGVVSVGLAAVMAGSVAVARAHGFSAREKPSAIEALMARRARATALPAGAKARANPVLVSAEVLADARAHWADHCAACHANDGSGETELGQSLYPPAPDMRRSETQQLTDGELFYIIENGVRLSGMPAWGGSDHGTEDSWKLVRFIRRLPSLSPGEIQEMRGLNPKSSEEREEEQQEERFLKGEPPKEAPKNQHRH